MLSAILGVISAPYNAGIIAHERMKVFAFIGIVDVVLKLLIVYLLLVIPYDKLKVYAVLFFCIAVFDRIVYGVYCKEAHAKCAFAKPLFKEIFGFAALTMNGNLTAIRYTKVLYAICSDAHRFTHGFNEGKW